ncbi:hypothetical protein Tco_1428996 [Tanacetum coccineum]
MRLLSLPRLEWNKRLRTYAERQSDNKRKADDSSRNNHGHQQQPFKRQNVAKVYNMGTGKRKPYGGSLPKCIKCHLHHNGPCTQKCHKSNKVGHFARDCRSTGNTNWNEYLRKGRKTKPKRQNRTWNGKAGKVKVQAQVNRKSTQVNPEAKVKKYKFRD